MSDPARCPHCGAVAGVEPHARLRYRCRVCGAPRIAVADPSVPTSGHELAPLRSAQRQRFRTTAWRVGAVVVGGFGLLALLVTMGVLLIASPGPLGTSLALLITAVPLLMAGLAWRQGNRDARELQRQLDQAWLAVARDLLGRHEQLSGARLGQLLGTGEQQAEQLLAELNLEADIRSEVTSEGELVYSTRAPRLRVDVAAPDDEEAADVEERPRGRSEA